jgi:hypothetical protein
MGGEAGGIIRVFLHFIVLDELELAVPDFEHGAYVVE